MWYKSRVEWKENAIKVDATVSDMVLEESSNGPIWATEVEYEYKGDTHTYMPSVRSNPKPYEIGDNVTILIDPEDNSKVMLDSKTELFFGPFMVGIFFIFTLLGAIGLILLIGFIIVISHNRKAIKQ